MTDAQAASQTRSPRAGGRSGSRRGSGVAIGRPRRSIDLATILGLVGALSLIVTAMVLGGSASAFFDLRSVLIVILGTIAVTMISFSLKDFFGSQKLVFRAMTRTTQDPRRVAWQMLQLAEVARGKGPLALQPVLDELRAQPFAHKAFGLVADGMPGEEIDKILTTEIESLTVRHDRGTGVLRRAAEVAPAMGLIGTLVGLVQMLGNLSDPSSIGPAMAVALLTTFYGAILANVVLSPLAFKLERNSDEEVLAMQLVEAAAGSIARQENPRRLEMMLNTILPPAMRVQYFD